MKSKIFSIQKFKVAVLLLSCLLLSGMKTYAAHTEIAVHTAPAPEQEFTRTINREFGTTADGMTALYNKYGKVNVNTWNNNSVKIDITIVVNANKQSDADRVFDRIHVNFTNTAGYVKAETVIDQANSKNWVWVGQMLDGNNEDFKINYEVWMPVGNQLDLKNKYGDSFVGNMNGKLTAEIKYGYLRTETISNDCDLSLGYGKANMARINNLNGQVSYSEVAIGQSKDIQLDTKYSNLKLDRAGDIKIISKYDEVEMGTIADLRLQTKYSNYRAKSARSVLVTCQYTDITVDNLLETVDADMSYGSLKINDLNRNFKDVTVLGSYTDLGIYVERGAAYRFDLSGSYTDISYPANAGVNTEDKSATWEAVKGFVGDERAKSMIKAKLKYGDLKLK